MARELYLSDYTDPPISSTKVRAGIYAYKYRSGGIQIEGTRYFFYSTTAAIKKWRIENPKRR